MGCEQCHDGFFEVTECPMKFIGSELADQIQIVGMSEYHLPVAGGLLDQSGWFIELKTALASEERLIEEEKNKRR